MSDFKLHFSNDDWIVTELEAETEEEAINELYEGHVNFFKTDKGNYNLATMVRIERISGDTEEKSSE